MEVKAAQEPKRRQTRASWLRRLKERPGSCGLQFLPALASVLTLQIRYIFKYINKMGRLLNLVRGSMQARRRESCYRLSKI